MLLRTYPLIVHPAFIAHVERAFADSRQLSLLPTPEIPEHLLKIQSIDDIAEYLKISPLLMRSMILRKERHYRHFRIAKRSGGFRTIQAPRTFLKVVQWWILDAVLSRSEVPANVHGFVPGRSFITNAQRHVGATNILNVDIKDFFSSTSRERVEGVFRAFGYGPGVARRLADLTTYDGCLPQGAPTSPAIANLNFIEIDRRLAAFSELYGLTYTRYADDLTFSGVGRIPASILADIGGAIGRCGYELNVKKTKFMA